MKLSMNAKELYEHLRKTTGAESFELSLYEWGDELNRRNQGKIKPDSNNAVMVFLDERDFLIHP